MSPAAKVKKDEEAVVFTEVEQQIMENASKGLEGFSEITETSSRVFESMKHFHMVFSGALGAVVRAIPPLHLLSVAVLSIWDLGTSALLGKESKARQAVKAGFAITGIALAAVAIAVPPVAAILVAVGAGVALGKQIFEFGHTVMEYRNTSKLLEKTERQLQEAEAKGDTAEVKTLSKRALELRAYKTTQKYKMVEGGINIALGVTSVVGAALLATPLAPIGGAILAAVAVVGIATRIASYFMRKNDREIKAIQEKIKTLESDNVEPKAEQALTLQETEKADLQQGQEKHNTASIYEALAKDQVLHNGKSASADNIAEEARQEIKQGLEDLHKPEPEPKPTPTPTPKATTNAVAKKEEEDESEGEDEGPHGPPI